MKINGMNEMNRPAPPGGVPEFPVCANASPTNSLNNTIPFDDFFPDLQKRTFEDRLAQTLH